MEHIYYLLIILLFFWYFIYQRKVAEIARFHTQKYCQQENLQYIAIARLSTRPKFNKKLGFYWLSKFTFDFSGDGVAQYQGITTLQGYKLYDISLPAYRI